MQQQARRQGRLRARAPPPPPATAPPPPGRAELEESTAATCRICWNLEGECSVSYGCASPWLRLDALCPHHIMVARPGPTRPGPAPSSRHRPTLCTLQMRRTAASCFHPAAAPGRSDMFTNGACKRG